MLAAATVCFAVCTASLASAWQLRNDVALDAPAGRYTQTRIGSDGLATIVWNGEKGLRISRCVDAACVSQTPPTTVPGTDNNPRFIRMEIAPGNLPVIAYAAANDTEARVTWCNDPACTMAVATTKVASAKKVRHCNLVLAGGVTDDVFVTVGLSDPSSGSFLVAGRASRGTEWVGRVIASSPVAFGLNETTGLLTGGLEMPSIVLTKGDAHGHGARGEGARAGKVHVAYYDVVGRSLKIVMDALATVAGSVVTVASSTSPASTPGYWPRMVQAGTTEDLVVAFDDLAAGTLSVAQCSQASNSCTAPRRVDTVGQRDVSDYGGGAFPDFRNVAAALGAGPKLVYFNELQSQGGTGQLKMLECSDAHCRTSTVSVLATGKGGFGRDCSFAVRSPAAPRLAAPAARPRGAGSAGVKVRQAHGQDSTRGMWHVF